MIKKGLGFHNVFSDEVFVHYPAKISKTFHLDLANEDRKIIPYTSSYDRAYIPENHRLPPGFTLFDVMKGEFYNKNGDREVYLMAKDSGIDLSKQIRTLSDPNNMVMYAIKSDREKVEAFNDHIAFTQCTFGN